MGDSYKFYLSNLTSQKAILINQWFDSYKKDIKEIIDTEQFKENTLIITGGHPFIRSTKRIGETKKKIYLLFEDKRLTGQYESLSILSKEGIVLISTNPDFLDKDLSKSIKLEDGDLFSNTSLLAVFDRENKESIKFIAPINDLKGERTAFLYVTAPLEKLSSILDIKNGLYKSERLEIINKKGEASLTKEGLLLKKEYGLIFSDGLISQKDGRIFFSKATNMPDTYLVASISKFDAFANFYLLGIIYLFMIASVIFLMFLSVRNSKKILSEPIEKISDFIKSIGSGEFNVDLSEKYKGELKELSESLKKMKEELFFREFYIFEKGKLQERSRLRSRIYNKFLEELKPLLPYVPQKTQDKIDSKDLKAYEGNLFLKGTIEDYPHNYGWLLQLSEDLSLLYMIEDNNLSPLPEEFNLSELLRDIEIVGKKILSTKGVELIVDYQDIFSSKNVFTDKRLLKKILMNLLLNSIRLTKTGTITILCNEIIRHEKEYIEIFISDTGEGLQISENDDFSLPFNLLLVKKLSNLLGGRMEIESTRGKGTTIRILILENWMTGAEDRKKMTENEIHKHNKPF